jgi:predicted CXXCH cytochrome family protein
MRDSTLKALTLLCGLALTAAVAVTAVEKDNSCVTCHKELEARLAEPVDQVSKSVHHGVDLSCAGCHGGDPSQDDAELAMSPARGFIAKPDAGQIPKLCAKCHSHAVYMRNFNPNLAVDQYELYLTSRHGERWRKGDRKVAQCVSCHTAHNIRKSSDPLSSTYPTALADQCAKCHSQTEYMKPYGIATDQYDEYKASIHAQMLYKAGDLGAPTCNDCHGNHGAMPPGVSSISNVCGTCHLVQKEYFAGSPHKSAFAHNNISECEACHGNHKIQQADDTMLGTADGAVCVQCHEAGSRGFREAERMRAGLDKLQASVAHADSLLYLAHKAGVAIKDDKLVLPASKDALTQARALVHTFRSSDLEPAVSKGMAAAGEGNILAQNAFKELVNRRRLLVAMVVLTLLVAVFLMLYIRSRYHEHGNI